MLLGLNYAPEPIGIGPYSAGLADTLAAEGHRVTAVVGKPFYPRWQSDPASNAHGWQASTEAGVHVVRCPHYIPTRPEGVKRIMHLLSFALSALPAALIAAWRQRPQVVFAVAPALLSTITAWFVARLCGAKLWIHVQDFEVETALATGLMSESGMGVRLGRWLEQWVLRRGDRVSTISPQMMAKLAAKQVADQRCYELRNWADARFKLDPAGAEALRAAWNIGQRKVALYSGNIARKQGIEILIDAARQLAQRDDIVFVICGEGPNRAALAERAAGLANVQLRDLQPVERMGAMLAMADFHLLPQIAGAADLVLPSKLTNMLASGRPVVATTEPGTGLHAEVDGCGPVVPPGDAAGLAKAIEQLADDSALRARFGENAAARAAERWQQRAILTRFMAELQLLVALR
jgi:colanic acid biosynthesis glycosyl transferase WcaI